MKRLLAIIILLLCLPVFVFGCTEPSQTPVDPTPPEQTDPTPPEQTDPEPTPPEQTDPEPTPPEQTFAPAPPGTFYDIQTAYSCGYLTRSDLMHFSYFTTGKVYEGVHGEYSIERTEIDFVPEYDRPDYTLTAQEDYNIRKNYFENHKRSFMDIKGNLLGDENDLTVYSRGCYSGSYIVYIDSSLWESPDEVPENLIGGVVIIGSPKIFRYNDASSTPPEQTAPEPTPPEQTFDPAPPGTFYDIRTAYSCGYLTRSDLMHFSYFTTGKVYEGEWGESESEWTEIDFVPEYDCPDPTLTAQEDYNIRKNYFENYKRTFMDAKGNLLGDESSLTINYSYCFHGTYIIVLHNSLQGSSDTISKYSLGGLMILVPSGTRIFRYTSQQ